MAENILTENEAALIVLAVAHGMDTFTMEDGERVLDWARDARLDATLLEMVLDGKMAIDVKDGDLRFILRQDAERSAIERELLEVMPS